MSGNQFLAIGTTSAIKLGDGDYLLLSPVPDDQIGDVKGDPGGPGGYPTVQYESLCYSTIIIAVSGGPV